MKDLETIRSVTFARKSIVQAQVVVFREKDVCSAVAVRLYVVDAWVSALVVKLDVAITVYTSNKGCVKTVMELDGDLD